MPRPRETPRCQFLGIVRLRERRRGADNDGGGQGVPAGPALSRAALPVPAFFAPIPPSPSSDCHRMGTRLPDAISHAVVAPRFGAQSKALIVDGHATHRNILASHLRTLGVAQVLQASRASEALQQLATRGFDVVLCELRLGDGSLGQDLIEEGRRRGVLPLSTVVVMLSSDASYDVVAEVAEFALDGFLVKPYSPGDLEDRLMRAFVRKESLRPILADIEAGRDAEALGQCEQRFQSRGRYWTSAARFGAELAIKLGQLPLATTMFEAVLADKAVPWARLGMARVLDADRRPGEALSTLRDLLAAEPTFVDAYDILGKIYAEQGDYPSALKAFRQASEITPNSVVRLQKYGVLCHYAGDPDDAERALERVLTIGWDSPAFDPQTLMLLAIARFRRDDAESLRALRARLEEATMRLALHPPAHLAPEALLRLRDRLARFGRMVVVLDELMAGRGDAAAVTLEAVAAELEQPDFDVEAALNLLSLVAMLQARHVALPAGDAWTRAAALRFAVSRHVCELLSQACSERPTLAQQVKAVHAEVSEAVRRAVSEAMNGHAQPAVEWLLQAFDRTHNLKLLEVGSATLERYKIRIGPYDALRRRCDDLLSTWGTRGRSVLGQAATASSVPGD